MFFLKILKQYFTLCSTWLLINDLYLHNLSTFYPYLFRKATYSTAISGARRMPPKYLTHDILAHQIEWEKKMATSFKNLIFFICAVELNLQTTNMSSKTLYQLLYFCCFLLIGIFLVLVNVLSLIVSKSGKDTWEAFRTSEKYQIFSCLRIKYSSHNWSSSINISS